MKHANVALFVPHNGCPHQCSFCNQKSITGVQEQPSPGEVHKAAREALALLGEKAEKAEIAFFGGSFTAVERGYMISLLEAAACYVGAGGFSGIRISTRPDAVSTEILELLKEYRVTAVELGAQSMDDGVLRKNGRGHTAADVEEAAIRLREHGFELGLQMMTGLYGSSPALDWHTGERIAALHPDTVRIYPTVVMKGTKLAALYETGDYRPPDVEESIPLCAALLDLFEETGIRVIRLGLHDTPMLHRDFIAGAWHPALRELCEGERFLRKASEILNAMADDAKEVLLRVNPSCVSKMTGQKKRNLLALQEMGFRVKIAADERICGDGVCIKAEKPV